MKSKIGKLCLVVWTVLAVLDATQGQRSKQIQLEAGTIYRGAVAGIVRVLFQGKWGTVCHNSWNMPDTKVACRALGYAKAVGYWHYGRGSGKIWMDNVRCSGTEFSLADCSAGSKWRPVTWCSHGNDVGVVCAGHVGSPAFNIQLEPGTGGTGVAGIVRVIHNGRWGTVCHNSWNMPDTKVACRQLGFTKAEGYWHYGRGSGKVWMNDLRCSGTEASLADCSANKWRAGAWCNHGTDVGVVCSGFKVPGNPNATYQGR